MKRSGGWWLVACLSAALPLGTALNAHACLPWLVCDTTIPWRRVKLILRATACECIAARRARNRLIACALIDPRHHLSTLFTATCKQTQLARWQHNTHTHIRARALKYTHTQSSLSPSSPSFFLSVALWSVCHHSAQNISNHANSI